MRTEGGSMVWTRMREACVGGRGRGAAAGLLMVMSGMVAGCDRGPESGVAFTPTISFGEVGAGPGQFSYPRSLDVVEVGGSSRIWVVDKLARIQCLDADTGEAVGVFRTPAWQLGKPTGITAWRSRDPAFDPSIGGLSPRERTLLFVPDTHYHRVLVYDTIAALEAGGHGEVSPKPMLEFGEYGKGPGQLIYPTDVAVLEDARGAIQRLYVSEYGSNDRVSIYEPIGATIDEGFRFVRSFGVFGAGTDPKVVEFNRPQSLEIDASRGWLVVTDACNHRVGVLTLEGEPIRWMGEYEPGGDPNLKPDGAVDFTAQQGGTGAATSAAGVGSAVGDTSRVRLRYPYGLALRGDGTAVVSEFGAARVHLIDLETGTSLATYGVRGSGPGELAAPWAVGLAHGGSRVLVLDSGNNRVQGFDLGAMVKRQVAHGGTEGRAGSGAGNSNR